MSLASIVENFRREAARSGVGRACSQFGYDATNRLLHLRRYDVIHLRREFLAPLDMSRYAGYASRLATERDLLQMQAEGGWSMTDELIEGFRHGDQCLLSSINGDIAGYTWVHTAGRPRLIPGLRLSIPEEYAYNFAGFTLPKFRGAGLQPYRHHAVLDSPAWRDRVGMIGYVEVTNWSSKRGQAKSGYRRLGTVTLAGTHRRFVAHLSATLKAIGIRRIPDSP